MVPNGPAVVPGYGSPNGPMVPHPYRGGPLGSRHGVSANGPRVLAPLAPPLSRNSGEAGSVGSGDGWTSVFQTWRDLFEAWSPSRATDFKSDAKQTIPSSCAVLAQATGRNAGPGTAVAHVRGVL